MKHPLLSPKILALIQWKNWGSATNLIWLKISLWNDPYSPIYLLFKLGFIYIFRGVGRLKFFFSCWPRMERIFVWENQQSSQPLGHKLSTKTDRFKQIRFLTWKFSWQSRRITFICGVWNHDFIIGARSIGRNKIER